MPKQKEKISQVLKESGMESSISSKKVNTGSFQAGDMVSRIRRPHWVVFGIFGLVLVIGVIGFVYYTIVTAPVIPKSAIITKQRSQAVAGYKNIQWVKLVKLSRLKEGQKFLNLPKNASSLSFAKIDRTQALAALKDPRKETSLAREDKKILAGIISPTVAQNTNGLVPSFLFDVETDIVNVVEGSEQGQQSIDISSYIEQVQAPSEVNSQEVKEPQLEQPAESNPENAGSGQEVSNETQKSEGQDEVKNSNASEESTPGQESPGAASPDSQKPNVAIEEVEGEQFLMVEYETPAPALSQEPTDNGKDVIVSSPVEESIEDVTVVVSIEDKFDVQSLAEIEVKDSDGNKVAIKGEDLDEDGTLDYIEWNEKELKGEETFSVSIISKAALYDTDGTFVENVYRKVVQNDNTYARISDGQYVTLAFRDVLNSGSSIAVYAKAVNPQTPASITIYENGNEKAVAVISNITKEGIYEAKLEGLNDSSTKEFDLRVTGDVEVDYFVDPSTSAVITGDHWVMTPTGPKNMVDIKVGDQVVGYEFKTGEKVTNAITSIQTVNPNAYGYWELDDQGNNKTYVIPPFVFYRINGTYTVYKDQSIWVVENNKPRVVHAFEIKKGDYLYSDSQQEILVDSIEEVTNETQWTEFTVSGNHSYIANGLTLHNGSRYWVGGGSSANWSATTNTNWGSASNTQDNASVPTSTDDVFFDGVGTGASNSTLSAGITIKTLDMTGYANTLTHNSAVTLTIAGNTFKLAGTYTLGNALTSALNFTSTSGTTAITTGGKTIGDTTFNGVGGTFQLQDNVTMGVSNTVTLTNGTLDTNGKNITSGIFLSSNSNVRTLTLGASTITLSGGGTQWNFSTSTNLTFNANTSQITIAEATFAGGGLTYNNVTLNSAGTAMSMTGANTFASLSVNSTATKISGLTFSATQVVTGTLTLNGNSAVNRLAVASDTIGTARTLNAATIVTKWADYRDITAAGAANWDLTAQSTDSSGNSGGNSGITFTTAATQYWKTTTTGSKTWSTAANWFLATNGGGGAGRVPLPQDNVVLDANSIGATGTIITQDMPRAGKSIDWTGVTNTPTWTTSTAASVFGSLTLVGSGSMTLTNNSGSGYTFEGRSSSTLTSAGQTITKSITLSAPGGTLLLGDDYNGSTGSGVILTSGTFDANGHNYTSSSFQSSNANTRTLTMGSGTWTLTGNAQTVWNTGTATSLTFNRGNAIILNYSGSTGTRTVSAGSTTGGSETNAPDFSVTAGSDTVSFTAPNSVRNLDFTGFTGTLSNNAITVYGNVTLASGMTVSAGSGTMTFAATSGTKTITSNGKTMDFPLTFNGSGGTFQLADNAIVGSAAARTITLTAGTFALNGKNLTHLGTVTNTGASTRAVSFGGGTWDITNTATSTIWNASGSGFTTSGSGTIKISGATTNVRTFAGGGFTYTNNIWFSNATAAGELDFTGSNTFAGIQAGVEGNAQTIKFTAATTTTISAASGWLVTGAASNLITIGSITAAGHTISAASGNMCSNYISLSRSTGTGGATFYAGANSTDGGNNSGWSFTTCNNTPSISAGPSDGGSSSTTPTAAGNNVTFTATATDADSNNYYLAICKTNSVTAVNNGAPTCGGGSWAISSSTASGVQASVTYTTSASDAGSDTWYAFVCDHNAASACSASSQGSGDNGSPFFVNTAPSISAGPSDGGSTTSSPTIAGANVTFTATASDTNSDNYYLAICKTNSVTATNNGAPTCGGGSWAISSSTASAAQASVSYTTSASDAGSDTWYAFVCDASGTSICSASSQGSGNNGSPFYVNASPSITAGPSDGGSSSTTPTAVGSNVTFTATGTDGDSDNYYLAICKTNSITANASAAPTCPGGSWAISSSTASGAQASTTFTTTSSESGSDVWYAFVCDHDTGSLCSAVSQGSGNNGSPFYVNVAPTISAGPSDGGSTTTNPTVADNNVTFTATGSDGNSDNFYLAICKTNSVTANNNAAPTCGGGSWAISSSTASGAQASVTYTTSASDAGSKDWYAFVCDASGTSLCSSSSQGTGGNGSPFYVNARPSISAGPSDGGSSVASPTIAGANVTFTATGTDGDSDNYYLAICKTNSITANGSAAPSCDGGNWAISTSTASGVQASVTYTTSLSDVGSKDWYAFVCDHDTGSLCSSVSQGSGNNGSPFYVVNSAPSISAGPSDGGSSTSSPTSTGSNVTFTATASDSQNENYYLAICKTNSVTANNSAAPSCPGGNWAISTSIASGAQASVTYTTSASDAGSKDWYAFVCDHDSGSLCSSASQGSGNNGSPFYVNSAPSISAGPSDGGSAASTPTNAGSDITFTATASDTESNNYYLAICKTNSVTANASAAPSCGGGSWAISSSTAAAAQASVTYTTLAGDSESNDWYAFVCDHDAGSLCSAASQGSGDSGSPFKVNHAPSFSGISYSGNNFGAGANIDFTATASDSDTDTTSDTVDFYLCKANDFTGSACGSGGEWCHTAGSSSNPSCTYTVHVNDGNGAKSYYGFIVDNHSSASSSNPVSGSFTTQTESQSQTPSPSPGGGGEYIHYQGDVDVIAQIPETPSVQPPTTPPPPPLPPIDQIIKEIEKAQDQFTDIIFPSKQPEQPLPSAESLVTKETPIALRGKWNLLAVNQIREFTLAPLPSSLQAVAKEFPKFGLVLTKLGIEKMTELEKLNNVALRLPGLNETIGIPQGKQLVALSEPQKETIPNEILFAKADGLLDISHNISINDSGKVQHSINVMINQNLDLIVKPLHPAESIKGYLVFVSRSPISKIRGQDSFLFPIALAAEVAPEKRLVLQEFSYTQDPNNPGIYTAKIRTPQDYGQYNIITEINYKDKQYAKKEIEMITVIDPEGYVYKRIGDNKLPLKNAKVTLFWLDPTIKQYQPWPAKTYSQENPQLTDDRGNYSFLVPEGTYYVQVEARGYLPYQSEQFQVREGRGVRFNIELTAKYWWLNMINWEAVLLIIAILVTVINIFKGRFVNILQRRKLVNVSNS